MKQYIVDAFTDKVFAGNQAAVCVMNSWPDDKLMMSITAENNFSETAFAVKEADKYRLRWFTPGGEIDLCGHATLAAAYVILNFYADENKGECVKFNTLSGELSVTKQEDLYAMDFPAYELKPVQVTDIMEQAIGVRPREAYMGRDLLCVLDNEKQIRELKHDMAKVKELDGLLLQVTARSESGDYDCVSRTFAPKLNVIEDPVCGSGHCHIVPYWADKIGSNKITAYQASKRGGTLYCEMLDNKRVKIAGHAALFSCAEILPEFN